VKVVKESWPHGCREKNNLIHHQTCKQAQLFVKTKQAGRHQTVCQRDSDGGQAVLTLQSSVNAACVLTRHPWMPYALPAYILLPPGSQRLRRVQRSPTGLRDVNSPVLAGLEGVINIRRPRLPCTSTTAGACRRYVGICTRLLMEDRL